MVLALPAAAQGANKPLIPNSAYSYRDSPVSGVIGRTDAAGRLQLSAYCRGAEELSPVFAVKKRHGVYGFKLAGHTSLGGSNPRGYALQDAKVSPNAHKILGRLNLHGYPKGCKDFNERDIVLALDTSGKSIVLAPPKLAVPPAPAPAPGASSLTMACQPAPDSAPWVAGRPYEITGQLAPDTGKSAIQVTWTDGAGSHSATATTGAPDGRWSASVFFMPGSSSSGPFTVSARFAGDATRAGSAATECAGEWATAFKP